MTVQTDPEAHEELNEQLSHSADPLTRADRLFGEAVTACEGGRYDDARTHLELAILQAPDHPAAQLSYNYIKASILDDEGNKESALLSLDELLHKQLQQLLQPENRDIYEAVQQRRADANVALRRFEDAIPILRELLTFDLVKDRRARNLANLGFAYFEMKKYFEAQQALLGALEFEQPANWHGLIHLYLGLTYAKLRKLREAEKELLICADRAHEWNLSLSNTYGWLAKVYKRLGDSARSKEYERLALTV